MSLDTAAQLQAEDQHRDALDAALANTLKVPALDATPEERAAYQQKVDALLPTPAPEKPTVTFDDLVKTGTVVASGWENEHGFTASVEIKHPNGHTYEVRAWANDNDRDAEAWSDPVEEIDGWEDKDGDDAVTLIDFLSWRRDKYERTINAAHRLSEAARALLAAEADTHNLDVQAHDNEDKSCTYCTLAAVITEIDAEPCPKVTPADETAAPHDPETCARCKNEDAQIAATLGTYDGEAERVAAVEAQQERDRNEG